MTVTDTNSPFSICKVDVSSKCYPYARSVVCSFACINAITEEHEIINRLDEIRTFFCTSTRKTTFNMYTCTSYLYIRRILCPILVNPYHVLIICRNISDVHIACRNIGTSLRTYQYGSLLGSVEYCTSHREGYLSRVVDVLVGNLDTATAVGCIDCATVHCNLLTVAVDPQAVVLVSLVDGYISQCSTCLNSNTIVNSYTVHLNRTAEDDSMGVPSTISVTIASLLDGHVVEDELAIISQAY